MRKGLSQASNEIKELQIKTADKERLEKDLMEVKKDYKSAIDEKFKVAEKSQKFELELDKTKQLLDSSKNELMSAEKRLRDFENALDLANHQVNEKEAFIETKSKEYTSLDLQSQKLQLALDQVTFKVDELKDNTKEFKTSIKEKETELLKVEHKSGSLSGELKAVTTENKGLKEKITELELMLSKKDSK
jgi:chromosome segregation ATPase